MAELDLSLGVSGDLDRVTILALRVRFLIASGDSAASSNIGPDPKAQATQEWDFVVVIFAPTIVHTLCRPYVLPRRALPSFSTLLWVGSGITIIVAAAPEAESVEKLRADYKSLQALDFESFNK